MKQSLVIDHVLTTSLDRVLELDRRTFNGLWTREHYQKEILRPNSLFLGVFDHSLMPDQGRDDNRRPIQKKSPQHHFPKLIAMASLWGIVDEAHITLIGVDPTCQAMGIGTLLMNRLLFNAQTLALARATLEVRQSNQAAIRLYEAFQFQRLGERRNYYTNGETALIYWLKGLHESRYFEFLSHQWSEILQKHHLNGRSLLDKVPSSPPKDTEYRSDVNKFRSGNSLE